MAKRFTDTNKYKKPFIRGLQGAYKVLWDYLYHDCDHAGIWIVDFEVAQIYVGSDLPINKISALEYFNESEERIIEIDHGKKWFLPSFIEFQYGELNEQNRAHNSVIKILKNKGLLSPLQGAKEKDKDKDKDKDKVKDKKEECKINKTIPPTLEMICDYKKIRGTNVNTNKFFNHYEAKAWMIGKNKMKDWHAAFRTWEPEKIEQKTNDPFITH